MKTGLLLLAWAVSATVTAWVRAAETDAPPEPRFTVQGFGTLGVVHSDDRNAQYVRDLSQPYGVAGGWSGKTDSVLGIQAGYHFDAELDVTVQAVSRYRYDGSWRPEVTWAYLRYEPDAPLVLRLGRLGTEFYMQADSRLVGYANLTVRPPPDYFGPLIFNHIDGADLALAKPVGEGLVRAKVFAGVSPESSPFWHNISWDLSGSLLTGGYVDYVFGPWQFRLGHDRIRFNEEMPLDRLFPGALAAYPELQLAGSWSRFDSVGVAYDQGPLQVQLMLSRIRHESELYENSRSGYAVAAYRVGRITPYAGYSWCRSTPQPPGTDPGVLAITAPTHADQHTWILGARWDMDDNLALKAQIDRIEGKPGSMFLYRYPNPAWDGRATVFSLALDFMF